MDINNTILYHSYNQISFPAEIYKQKQAPTQQRSATKSH